MDEVVYELPPCYRSSTGATLTCLQSPELKRKKNDYTKEKKILLHEMLSKENFFFLVFFFFFFDISPAQHSSACTIDWFLYSRFINVHRIFIVEIVLMNWRKSNYFDISSRLNNDVNSTKVPLSVRFRNKTFPASINYLTLNWFKEENKEEFHPVEKFPVGGWRKKDNQKSFELITSGSGIE